MQVSLYHTAHLFGIFLSTKFRRAVFLGCSVVIAKVRQILQLSNWLVFLDWSHLLMRINHHWSLKWTSRLLAALSSGLCHQGLSCLCNLPHSHVDLLLLQLLRQDPALYRNHWSLLFSNIIRRNLGYRTCNGSKSSNSQVCFRDFHQQYWVEQCWNCFHYRTHQCQLGIRLSRLCNSSCGRSPST